MIVRENIEFIKSDNPLRNMGIGLISKISKITSDDLGYLKVYTDNGDGKGHENEELFAEICGDSLKDLKRVKEVYNLLEPYEYLFGDSFETGMKAEIRNFVKSYLKNPKYNYAYDCGFGDEEVDVFFCEIQLPGANEIRVKR